MRRLLCREQESERASIQKARNLEGYGRLCVCECCACGALVYVWPSVLETWPCALDSEFSLPYEVLRPRVGNSL